MKKTNILKLCSSIWLLALTLTLQGQSAVLDKYVTEALESNLTVQGKQLSYEKSLSALRESKGLFYPNVSFNMSYQLSAGGRTLDFPIGDLFNPIYATLNQITNTNQFPTNLENINEQILLSNFHDTKIRIVQPLFNSNIYFNYKAKQELVSLEVVKKETYKKQLTRDLKVGYYQYLQTIELLKIYAQTQTVLKELLRVNQKLVKYNKATKDVIYSAQYELDKLAKEKAIAEKNSQIAQAYFNFLRNKPLNLPIEIDTSLVLTQDMSTLEQLQAKATSSRLELQQLKYAMGANAQVIAMNDYAKYPQLNMVIDGGFTGTGYTFGSDQDYVFMQLGLSWNIFDGKQRQSKVEQAQIQDKILQNEYAILQQQIQLQVQQAFYTLQSTKVTLQASESSIRNAQQKFNFIAKRYKQNKATLLEYLDAENSYSNAQKSLTIDKYNYLIQKAELDWVSSQF